MNLAHPAGINPEKRAIHTARTSQNPGREASTTDAGLVERRRGTRAELACRAGRPRFAVISWIRPAWQLEPFRAA
jgi:hypothetical protein